MKTLPMPPHANRYFDRQLRALENDESPRYKAVLRAVEKTEDAFYFAISAVLYALAAAMLAMIFVYEEFERLTWEKFDRACLVTLKCVIVSVVLLLIYHILLAYNSGAFDRVAR